MQMIVLTSTNIDSYYGKVNSLECSLEFTGQGRKTSYLLLPHINNKSFQLKLHLAVARLNYVRFEMLQINIEYMV